MKLTNMKLTTTSSAIIGHLERFFTWWGRAVALHPYPVVLSCLLATAVSCLGFLFFRMEHRATLLWIPPDSDYNTKEAWLDENFRGLTRDQLVMFQSDNILTPQSLQEMYWLHKKIVDIEVEGRTFQDICARIPIADIFQTKRRRKRQAERDPTAAPKLSNSSEGQDDYYDIWEDYEEEEEDQGVVIAEERINFRKYGRPVAGQGGGEGGGLSIKAKEESTADQLPGDIYCDLLETLPKKCVQHTFLGAWRYDESLILTATQEEILEVVNRLDRSPWFGYGIDYSHAMGGIVRNSTGQIVAATTAQMYWRVRIPDGAELVASQSSGLELQLADRISLAWEDRFVEVSLNASKVNTATSIPNASKSFGDISSNAIFFDAFLMAGGYLIMFAYTILMLGRLNQLEVRLYLSVAGLTSIGMGILLSVGLASFLGFPYTPMHGLLPFICLGIGIDDMFVIMQCWENVASQDKNRALATPERVGLTLRHAGVSITVTSLTDIFAFGIGAVTKMPGLQSFCVCTAIALAGVYILTITWFTAWLALDEARLQAKRHGLLPCLQLPRDYTPSACSRRDNSAAVKAAYGVLLSSRLYRAVVLLATLGLLAVGLWGSLLIQQKFDPKLLLPGDSYLRHWLDVHDVMYPSNGHSADIYTGHLNWTQLPQLEELTSKYQQLQDEGQVLRGIESWWRDLKNYARDKKNLTSWQDFATESRFPELLSDFLFSSAGSGKKSDFRFSGELLCGQPAPTILASKFRVNYLPFPGPDQHIPARRAVDQAAADIFGPKVFSFNKIYAAWETDEIIGIELWRNIGLAMAAVFVVTLVLLANIQICVMVLLSVILTLVDIVGFLHFWDITIDIISCVNIVLAIGLCVDYSVHIGHAYMVAHGSRTERAHEAVSSIGLAVFNGGVTTFLALVLLGASSSHIFLSFFKVFVLTVVFGLYHGLILFPALLAMFGPEGVPPPPSNISVLGESKGDPPHPANISVLGESNPGRDNQTFVSDLGETKPSPWSGGDPS